MSDPLQAILQSSSANDYLFPPASRYHGLETGVLETPEGKIIIYLKRRFVPPADRFELLQEHAVTEGERLDHITAHYLGDPEQFWRLCDANNAMRPEELETISRELRITLPEEASGST